MNETFNTVCLGPGDTSLLCPPNMLALVLLVAGVVAVFTFYFCYFDPWMTKKEQELKRRRQGASGDVSPGTSKNSLKTPSDGVKKEGEKNGSETTV